MNGIYKTTYADWEVGALVPDPIPPDVDGETKCSLSKVETVGPFEGSKNACTVGWCRTIWTWYCYKIERPDLLGGVTRFDRVAPNSDIADVASWPIEDGEPGDDKSGRLVKLQATRAGDRVTVELALEFDAERLKSVLPMAHLYANNPGFPESWRAKILDAAEHIRSTIDGGAHHDRH